MRRQQARRLRVATQAGAITTIDSPRVIDPGRQPAWPLAQDWFPGTPMSLLLRRGDVGRRVPGGFATGAEDALHGADCVVLVTDWKEHRELDLVLVETLVRTPRVIDGCNILDPQKWRASGWTCRGCDALEVSGVIEIALEPSPRFTTRWL